MHIPFYKRFYISTPYVQLTDLQSCGVLSFLYHTVVIHYRFISDSWLPLVSFGFALGFGCIRLEAITIWCASGR